MKLPCPLSPDQCAALAELEARIPQVQAIVAECEECVVQIPGAAASLANSLTVVKAARKILSTHFDMPAKPE